MYNFGTVVEVKDINKMTKEVKIETTVLNEWDKQEGVDVCTPLVKEMVQFFDPVPTVIEFEKNSVADQIAKVDIALAFPEEKGIDEEGNEYLITQERTIGFQLKSSEGAALAHMEKNKDGTYYDGVFYPCPGVFWCRDINLDTLEALASFTGGNVNPLIYKAIELLKKIKPLATKSPHGLYFDARVMQTKMIKEKIAWQALLTLKLVTIAGGRMFYVE